MTFRDLPKVELHLHLDCSLSYAVVQQIAPALTPEMYRRQFVAPAKCTSLADFLTRAPQGFRLMQTERQLRLVTADVFAQLAADNVRYAELRFAPLQHLSGGLSAEEVVEIVAEETREQIERTAIGARLILCTLRHFSAAQSMQTVQLVEKFRGTAVAGFDIAADEAGFPIDAHVAAFRYAHRAGIPCTAHAGEARGADSVWETLQHLQPSRIGHGVRSIEDQRLLAHLKTRGIHLEVCPSCNVQIDIFATYADHPIDRLYREGLSVSINTDTRTITSITLSEEYEKLYRVFGWQPPDFLRCNLNAIAAAFLPEPQKKQLAAEFIAAYPE